MECKSELAEILESKDSLQSAVETLETALVESKKDKAKIVDSKKGLAIELEESKMQMKKKCKRIEALEEKIEYGLQQKVAGQTLSGSNSSSHNASEGACAFPKGREKGIVEFPKQTFSYARPLWNGASQGASGNPKSEEGTV